MRTPLLQEFYSSEAYKTKLYERFSVFQKVEEDPLVIVQMAADRWALDPVQFIEQFGWIINPKFNNEVKPFFLFDYQKRVIQKVWEAERSGEDTTILVDKVREMGLTWLIAWYCVWRWLFCPNWSGLILSRKAELVDDGTFDPSVSIFGKIRWGISMLPQWILPEGFTPKGKKGTPTDMQMKLINPQMSSVMRGETANENAGRGGRSSFVFFDECFFVQNFNSINNSVQATSNCKVYVSTSETGRQFEAFVKMIDERGNHITLSWRDNPFKDQAWYEEKLREAQADPTGEAMKEIEVSYAVPMASQYYPELGMAKVESRPYNRKLPLYCSADYGRQDHTVIIWWQFDGKEFSCVECIAKNKVDFDWFYPFLSRDMEYNPERFSGHFRETLDRVRGWERPRAVFGEPAHKQVHYPNKESIQMRLGREAGINLIVNDGAVGYEVRRKATSILLPRTVFNRDSPGAMDLYDALQNARYAGNSKGSSKESQMRPAHDDEVGDYRAAAENFYVNSPRILRRASNEDGGTTPLDDRTLSQSIINLFK